MATKRTHRQAIVKPTFAELRENWLRDAERERELGKQFSGINHARTAYLLRHLDRKDRTDADNAYFRDCYDALQVVEQRYRADAEVARQVAEASLRAWMASA